jgi:hypothetical protein
VRATFDLLSKEAYCSPVYIYLAGLYERLGYPDLAAGSAYKALLLKDAIDEPAEEYHDQATESMQVVVESQPKEKRKRLLDSQTNDVSNDEDAQMTEVQLWMHYHYAPMM